MCLPAAWNCPTALSVSLPPLAKAKGSWFRKGWVSHGLTPIPFKRAEKMHFCEKQRITGHFMCNELWSPLTPGFRPVEGEGQRAIRFKSCLASKGRQDRKGCWGLVLTWVNHCSASEREGQSLRVPVTERKDAELHLCVWVLPTDRPFSEEIPLNRNPDPSVFLRANEQMRANQNQTVLRTNQFLSKHRDLQALLPCCSCHQWIHDEEAETDPEKLFH